jgi:hypothetical protein
VSAALTIPREQQFNGIRVPLQPKQKRLLRLVEESPATWIGYGGSRGGAKSHAARAIMLIRRLAYPGTRGCIFRRTYEKVREEQPTRLRILWGESPHAVNYLYQAASIFGACGGNEARSARK